MGETSQSRPAGICPCQQVSVLSHNTHHRPGSRSNTFFLSNCCLGDQHWMIVTSRHISLLCPFWTLQHASELICTQCTHCTTESLTNVKRMWSKMISVVPSPKLSETLRYMWASQGFFCRVLDFQFHKIQFCEKNLFLQLFSHWSVINASYAYCTTGKEVITKQEVPATSKHPLTLLYSLFLPP